MPIVESVFRRKLQAMLGSRVDPPQKTRVTGSIGGEMPQDGEVLVFALLDHLHATHCYAWEVDGHVRIALGRQCSSMTTLLTAELGDSEAPLSRTAPHADMENDDAPNVGSNIAARLAH